MTRHIFRAIDELFRPNNKDELVGFHHSIPMGYVESAAFFCATTETVKDRALDTLSMRHTAPPHHLENLAETKPPNTIENETAATSAADKDWDALSLHAWATALAHVEVYLDDFISITQGGDIDAVPERGKGISEVDVQCPILSVP